jgi:hypothetical protein
MQQTPALPGRGPASFDFDHPNQLFPQVVAESPFHLATPRDPIPQNGIRILLGVVTWSGYDMALLDRVESAIQERNGTPLQFDVFNGGLVKTMAEFRAYVPDLADFIQMPVLGIWRNGKLTETATGHKACDLLGQMFGFKMADVVAVVDEFRAARA